eukprot:358009-Pleurochrysis_carterae.AAC.1
MMPRTDQRPSISLEAASAAVLASVGAASSLAATAFLGARADQAVCSAEKTSAHIDEAPKGAVGEDGPRLAVVDVGCAGEREGDEERAEGERRSEAERGERERQRELQTPLEDEEEEPEVEDERGEAVGRRSGLEQEDERQDGGEEEADAEEAVHQQQPRAQDVELGVRRRVDREEAGDGDGGRHAEQKDEADAAVKRGDAREEHVLKGELKVGGGVRDGGAVEPGERLGVGAHVDLHHEDGEDEVDRLQQHDHGRHEAATLEEEQVEEQRGRAKGRDEDGDGRPAVQLLVHRAAVEQTRDARVERRRLLEAPDER